MRGSMTLEMVEERLALMTDFIQVFETVDPGLSKWRGKMLYQVKRHYYNPPRPKASGGLKDNSQFFVIWK